MDELIGEWETVEFKVISSEAFELLYWISESILLVVFYLTTFLFLFGDSIV